MKAMMIIGLILSAILFAVGFFGKTAEAFYIGGFILLGCFMLFMTLVKAKADEKQASKK